MARNVIRFGDHGDRPLCQSRRLARLGDRNLHDGELVAAHARDCVRITHHRAQANRYGLQQLVSNPMSERVVDILEQVEVEQVYRHDLSASGARQRLLQPFVEQGAIGQIRQPVVEGHMRYPGLVAPLLGNVLVRGDPPAICHGLMRDCDRRGRREASESWSRRVSPHGAEALVDIGFRISACVGAQCDARFNDLAKRRAGLNLLGVEAVHPGVAVVGDEQAPVRIEHAQTLGNVLQRNVDLGIGRLELDVEG